MVDGLHSLGRRLLGLGYGSPFLAIGMSYMYRCLADARLDVVRSGLVIQDDGLPKELGPMTFVFTGNGNVTKVRGILIYFGARESLIILNRELYTSSNVYHMNGSLRMISRHCLKAHVCHTCEA
jgi:hypothetical protein